MGRLKRYDLNALKEQRKNTAVGLLLSQFRSPLVLILIFAAIVSAFLGEWTDAGIVLVVVLGSIMLGFTTELVIALVVRTRRVFFRSRPGRLLLISTLIVYGITLVLPYIRINFLFGFVPLPAPLILTMLVLVALYVLVTEIAKKLFYSRVENQTA